MDSASPRQPSGPDAPQASPLNTPNLTRRQVSSLLLAGAATSLFLPSFGSAQPAVSPYKPASPATPAPVPSFLDNVISVRQGKAKDRTLRVSLHVQAYAEDPNRRPKQTPGTQTQPLDLRTLDFQTAAIVFPVIYGSSLSKTDIEGVKGVAKYHDKVIDSTPEYNDTYPCGTRLGKWTMVKQSGGTQVDLEVEIPMNCNAILFDERTAAAATWPNKWGKVGQSSFAKQKFVNDKDKGVVDLLNAWTGGQDPKKIPPLQLAKFLAAKCVEYFQFTGTGESYLQNGGLEGLLVHESPNTIAQKQGTEHDIACAVCAIYRAAGLPARTVIAYDVSETKGGDRGPFEKAAGRGEIRSYVEFCLYDEKADKELWVPVDIVRQRKKSSRAIPVERPWQYFGNYEDGDLLMPFAFQYHPPTTVVQYGATAFWGWLVTPTIPKASQFIRFNAIVTPKRGPSTPTRNR